MKKHIILAAVAGLAIALIASPAYAQRGGGGRGGGGGGRGGSWGGGGGRSWGGGGGSFYRGGYGGGYYGRGYGYGGYGRGFGYGGYGLGIGLGYPGYGGYYGGGYYGDGYSLGLNAGYPDYYPSADPSLYTVPYQTQPLVATPPDAPTINGNAPSVAMQSFYSGPSSSSGQAALTVKVPANAQVWLGSMQSGQQGPERHFGFPSLQGDNLFTLRATWTENGQVVTREKQVNMKAGANTTVDFNQSNDAQPHASNPNAGLPMPAGKADAKKITPPILPATGPPK